MEEADSSQPWPIFYRCPACQQEVEAVAGKTAQLRACPHCGEHFVVAGEDGSTDIPEHNSETPERSREEELDGLRIHRLARVRRAAVRSQSHCIIAAGACLIGAIDLLAPTIGAFHTRRWAFATIYLLLTAILVRGLMHFSKKAIALRAEALRHDLPEPATPPDLSTLRDGSQMESQRVKNLEELE